MKIPVGKHAHAIVDDGDHEALSKWRWHLNGRYATTGRGKITVKMEWMILKPPEGKVIDHKNGNGLDNRRENLRVATRKQNNANQRVQNVPGKSSRFKGVRFRPERGKWSAYVGDREYLGCYGSEEEAALAYNIAALARFREFAHLNEINGSPKQVAGIAEKLVRRRRRRIRLAQKREKYGPGWMTVLEEGK